VIRALGEDDHSVITACMPIILMTGFADLRERTHDLDALVHDAISKPFSVDQIRDAVREELDTR
jgi:two-component system cell cycle response regulator CpdR